MRRKTLWLASALMATLAVVGMTIAAPDDNKEGDSGKSAARKGGKDGAKGARAGRGGRGARGVTVDQIVERLMAFDKDKDGKITKDELPERMKDLIAQGDTNKDGALSKEEIKTLAAKLQREGFAAGFGGRGGRGGFGPGDGGRGGFGLVALERAVDDLKLSDKKKEAATAAITAYQENVRKLTELARADMLLKMKNVLSDEEFKKFKEAAERRPGFAARPPR
jgi:hypothetical protein